MKRFTYVRAASIDQAIESLSVHADAKLLAGGTNLIDLMKYDVSTPTTIIDINDLPLREINETADGGLRVGALVTNSEVAIHPFVARHYPLLASAIFAGASAQLRNAATVGGNLMQRTRCPYFYDVLTPCNKRAPGSGCPARTGLNRNHAILGASQLCVATHPSDMCVALAAIGATIIVQGPNGVRSIPLADFHRLPGDSPEKDTTLVDDEIILDIFLPPVLEHHRYSYLKIRDRLSYAFAIVSAAVLLTINDEAAVSLAHIALGGVAHKPWRNTAAEALLIGRPASRVNFDQFASMLLSGSVALSENDFKIDLAHRTVVRALEQAASRTPQSQFDKRVH
ncbi:xanthine dehydrogenase family protein subunit M [Phyllobacterium sp. BT25]|uniref:Xanthine dehydrogenase family protein subunit M n=1 Tax=Phyllobacterium pellucidum TaxID=2740464 RepID=A0A849VY08_9HYPH|nr:xanthine dehydrogenase family protein subunit M [Phyllobacterium pellucidum]NTS33187.1 xanthine dehydrogenase family protein subunit M [Phyllobacterium pellucidum]